MRSYQKLKEQYPEYISLEQLRIICHIAKRSAAYLLKNGIIKATDTGKKSWRYRVALDDVIDYLRRREKNGSMIPTGLMNAKKTHSRLGMRTSFSRLIIPGKAHEIKGYFTHVFTDYPDVVFVADLTEMTGLSKKLIIELLKSGEIKSIASVPRFLVPKPYVLEFVCSKRYLRCNSNSLRHQKLIDGFRAWQHKNNKFHESTEEKISCVTVKQ